MNKEDIEKIVEELKKEDNDIIGGLDEGITDMVNSSAKAVVNGFLDGLKGK